MTKLSFFVLALVLPFAAQALPLQKKNLSPEFTQAIIRHNQEVTQQSKILGIAPREKVPARPFSEVEEAGYLFFAAQTDFKSHQAKQIMARELPAGVTLVVYASPWDDKDQIKQDYADVIDASRLRVIELEGANQGFWTRDGFPIPVWSQEHGMDMVDSAYYHGFEPDQQIRGMFNNYLYRNDYYYEGGNLQANDLGDCIMIDNEEAAEIPDEIFSNKFGCKQLFRMPHEKGIGHIDETMRFVKSKTLVTDSPSYATTMRNAGFEVLMVPRPNKALETYVNALQVNGTVYVPQYNQPGDQLALDVFRSAGLNAVPIETITLSNIGMGSIHCITMTYPKVPFNSLLKMLGAKEL